MKRKFMVTKILKLSIYITALSFVACSNVKPSVEQTEAVKAESVKTEVATPKQQDEFQKIPKRRYIGLNAMELNDANYVQAWRQKAERVGNLNYPAAAHNQKLYGQLRVTVEINSDGSVENIKIDKSSGSKVLDEAARNIASLAEPYAKFSPELKRRSEILGISGTWMFTQENVLRIQAK
jgi:periplasmic protein TonB